MANTTTAKAAEVVATAPVAAAPVAQAPAEAAPTTQVTITTPAVPSKVKKVITRVGEFILFDAVLVGLVLGGKTIYDKVTAGDDDAADEE